MKPWKLIATARTPDGSLLELLRHDGDYFISADGDDLMNSRMHGSEEAMAQFACSHLSEGARVLVGGLGMGYTAAAALAMLPPQGTLVVSEFLPEVVAWNRGPLGSLADHPLRDPRVQIVVDDVADVIRRTVEPFDTILLDVDNGPRAFTDSGNSLLYTAPGLTAMHHALRPGGRLAIWSGADEPSFQTRLLAVGFKPRTYRTTEQPNRESRHVVFVGEKS